MNALKTIAYKIGKTLIDFAQDAPASTAAAPAPSARIAVMSSFIASIGFIPTVHHNCGILMVELKGGDLYAYDNVPRGIFDDFREADSKGAYLNQVIKPFYVVRPLDL